MFKEINEDVENLLYLVINTISIISVIDKLSINANKNDV